MRLPTPRGPVSAMLVDALRLPPQELPSRWPAPDPGVSGVHDEDLQLVLFLGYELHYGGFEDVSDTWEWAPGLLRLLRDAEERFSDALVALVGPPPANRADPTASIPRALRGLVDRDEGPSLAAHLAGRATMAQFREFLVHRSIYQLKEADPHTWGIPRLTGRPKAALVEIQAGEYGGGRPHLVHAELFRVLLGEVGLDQRYGAYVDEVPAVTLALGNAISLFGVHRRRRGQLAGHLAAFEMTSSMPNRRAGDGLRRLGGGPPGTRFFDEHVTADALHEQVAAHDLCGALVAQEPHLREDVLHGAACALALDRLVAEHLLGCWDRGESSLRPSRAAAVP